MKRRNGARGVLSSTILELPSPEPGIKTPTWRNLGGISVIPERTVPPGLRGGATSFFFPHIAHPLARFDYPNYSCCFLSTLPLAFRATRRRLLKPDTLQ